MIKRRILSTALASVLIISSFAPQAMAPQRRALAAACVFEGWARDRSEAAAMLAAGDISLASGNDHQTWGR